MIISLIALWIKMTNCYAGQSVMFATSQ